MVLSEKINSTPFPTSVMSSTFTYISWMDFFAKTPVMNWKIVKRVAKTIAFVLFMTNGLISILLSDLTIFAV